ncbi:hypothetical protein HYC85_026317 [Camellia sinensis]|uniref:Uncharacterized protein n=1 Tax=Camellia sinensis TaxID=4442 RepID=A0A7J7G6Y4_CAMSI|nr:hypothetical protein HYC85_026317 [Camellia sinensis]
MEFHREAVVVKHDVHANISWSFAIQYFHLNNFSNKCNTSVYVGRKRESGGMFASAIPSVHPGVQMQSPLFLQINKISRHDSFIRVNNTIIWATLTWGCKHNLQESVTDEL